jgi:hypothetical protein
MPYTAGLNPIFRPRFGYTGSLPLAQRFEHARNEALRELVPSDPEYAGIAGMMMSEQGIDAIEDALAVARKRKAPREPDAELRQAWTALSDLQLKYNRMVSGLKESQKRWLRHAQTDWKHKLLRSLRADMHELPPLIDTSKSFYYIPEYWNISIVRKTTAAVFAQLQRVEAINTLIANAISFDGLEPGAQAEHLCHALYDDNVELKIRLAAAESGIAALQAQLNAFVKPKRKTNG